MPYDPELEPLPVPVELPPPVLGEVGEVGDFVVLELELPLPMPDELPPIELPLPMPEELPDAPLELDLLK